MLELDAFPRKGAIVASWVSLMWHFEVHSLRRYIGDSDGKAMAHVELSVTLSTIVAGTTDDEGEIVPCSQEEGETRSCGRWVDIEEEIFATTVSDRVIKWANDHAEVDEFDEEVEITDDVVGDEDGGIRGEYDTLGVTTYSFSVGRHGLCDACLA